MTNFEKPLNEFTEEELQNRVNTWAPQYGALALYELQRRQQKENTTQIKNLGKEIETLKLISENNVAIAKQSADSDNELARLAIFIAIIALIFQTIFSIHNDIQCRFQGSKDGLEGEYLQGCTRTLDLGLFGTFYVSVDDILKSK